LTTRKLEVRARLAQETVAVSKEYFLKLTEMNIQTVESGEQGVSVSGTANFQMSSSTATNYAKTSYVIPDFSQTVVGTLKVSEDTPVIELRKVPIEEAKRLIYAFIKEHPGSRTSDLIIELELDPDIVLEVLSQLKNEQKVEGKDIARE
jgi:hypothetical protein